MKILGSIVLVLLLSPSDAWMQTKKPASIGELTSYVGADREQLLAASKGAPLEWVPMEIVPTNVGSAAVAANPPHPYSALLMVDFLLSPDGQGVLEKFYYGSATKDQRFKKWRPERGLTTDKYEKDLLRWEKLLKDITRK
jgi:ABC-type Fe3+ transport system substrate-binding protein